MIAEPHPLADDPEVRDALGRLPKGGSFLRGGSLASQPWHIEGHGTSDRWRADPALIERMVAGGLLIVTNAASGYRHRDGHDVPRVPWRCRLSEAGERLIKSSAWSR